MRRQVTLLVLLSAVGLLSCATATKNPYPPFDGRWLYDYEASAAFQATVPADFAESISRLDREGRNEDHRRLESIAMSLRPPEILRIEYLASVMLVRGGGGFKRDFELSNLNPAPGIEVKWDMVMLEAKVTEESLELTERYELSPDKRRLIITITMNSALLEKPLEMRWTYMAASAF